MLRVTRQALLESDHLLRINVPHLQPQAAVDINGTKRRGLGGHQFRNRLLDFRQAIERDAGIEVMNVVVADVGREPGHHWPRAQET